MTCETIGYGGAGYQPRFMDTATILHALGTVWKTTSVPDIAQDAADLYYRLKGEFVTNYYQRRQHPSWPL